MTSEMTRVASLQADFAAFDAFMDDYLEHHMDRLSELTGEEYCDLCEDEYYTDGFLGDEEKWRRASERAFEGLMDEAQEVWEREGNAPLREYAERLRQRVIEAEDNLTEATYLNSGMQVRMENWEVPPICKCGAVSYTVECSVCGRNLARNHRAPE
jgi:hypothetical protein